MQQLRAGSFRLFRVAGIQVYLHWTWFLAAYLLITLRNDAYVSDSPVHRAAWNIAEYLTLFAIVLLHEFGHALACRQVGGVANSIILWPLGGIAFVSPPPRPGAMLWSIAAGPLVNVVLLPITVGLYLLAKSNDWVIDHPNPANYLFLVTAANGVLLFFNLLPIYPLDGGQIVQALLWFLIGRAKSLMAVSILGLAAGSVILLGLLLLGAALMLAGSPLRADLGLLVVMAAFIVFRSWVGFQQARALSDYLAAPRHKEFACPSCGAAPVRGPYWVCYTCRERFDAFEEGALCPNCDTPFPTMVCPECQGAQPIRKWDRGGIMDVLPVEPKTSAQRAHEDLEG
jgi:Zn-dependent protease